MNWIKGGMKGPATRENTVSPMYRKGDLVDMYVYITEEHMLQHPPLSALVWEEKDLPLATLQPRNQTVLYRPSIAVQNNGSLFVHTLFTRAGVPPEALGSLNTLAGRQLPEAGTQEEEDIEEVAPGSMFILSHPLNRYLPKRKEKDGVSLLTSDNTTMLTQKKDANTTAGAQPFVSYIVPNVTISLVGSWGEKACLPIYFVFAFWGKLC